MERWVGGGRGGGVEGWGKRTGWVEVSGGGPQDVMPPRMKRGPGHGREVLNTNEKRSVKKPRLQCKKTVAADKGR